MCSFPHDLALLSPFPFPNLRVRLCLYHSFPLSTPLSLILVCFSIFAEQSFELFSSRHGTRSRRVSESFPHYNGCRLPPHLLLATVETLAGILSHLTPTVRFSRPFEYCPSRNSSTAKPSQVSLPPTS